MARPFKGRKIPGGPRVARNFRAVFAPRASIRGSIQREEVIHLCQARVLAGLL